MLILGEGKLHPTWKVNMGVKKGKRKEKNRHQPYARVPQKKGKRKEKNRHQPYARVPQPEQREETQRKRN